jgi:hypothetical protein
MTPHFRLALVALLVIPALVLLLGCASGVQMDEAEAIACRNEGCAVFTEAELRALASRAAALGYRKGWTDALRQRSEGI